MRRTPVFVSSVAVVTVLAAALAGCASSPDDVSACAPVIASGDTSSLVTATGEVGSEPKVSIPAPLSTTDSQRTVLENGSGLVAEKGYAVDFDAVIFDGASGSKLLATKFDGSQGVRFRADLKSAEEAPGPGSLAQALVCAQAGQRFSLTTTVLASGLDFSSVGLTDDDTVVLVIDVQNVFLDKADGVNQLPSDGMPVVVTAPDGTVGITIPSGVSKPSATRVETIKLGGGAALADGDQAVLAVAVWKWPAAGEDLSVLSSTWTVGKTPVTQVITKDPSGAAGISPGLYEGLLGAKVGSQLQIVVAPADNFEEGSLPSGTTKDDTLIYVIDVLGIRPADAK